MSGLAMFDQQVQRAEEMLQLAMDAMRYRHFRSTVSGHLGSDGLQFFGVKVPKPIKNVMQGSVAEHFDNAMDFDIGFTEQNKKMDAIAQRINNPLRLIPEPELSGGITVKSPACAYGDGIDCRGVGCGLLCAKPSPAATWIIFNDDVAISPHAGVGRVYWGGRTRLWVHRKNATEYTADEIGEELQYAERIAGSQCILVRP